MRTIRLRAMRSSRLAFALVSLLVAMPALAHVYLDAPTSLYVQNATGDPQKASIGVFAPCGVNIDGGDPTGTPSGAVTNVTAGQQLTLRWHDTIAHPGTFRIGVATRQLDFADAVTDGTCSSVAIESTPTYPVVADGILPHSGTSPDGGGWDYTITVPNLTCDAGPCVMQLVQFMLNHGAPGGSTCFYHHCAALRISPAGTGGGSGGNGGTGGGSGTGGGGDTGGGCSCDATPMMTLGSLLVLWGIGSRRRRS